MTVSSFFFSNDRNVYLTLTAGTLTCYMSGGNTASRTETDPEKDKGKDFKSPLFLF